MLQHPQRGFGEEARAAALLRVALHISVCVADQRNGLAGCSLLATIRRMYTIIETEAFADWLRGLSDTVTRVRPIKRLQRAALGNLGDVKPVGEGVFEMREFFGSGWRMYYVQQGDVLLIMLGGGDKSSQQRDIKRAIQLSREL